MKSFILAIALLTSYCALSQIGIGTPNPDQSAVLELASETKGFLPPRLTTTQRDAITNPVKGLTIYNTTKDCLEWYQSTGWYNPCGDNDVAIITQYDCTTRKTGTMIVYEPVYEVSQTITATVTKAGHYDISATANGVTFSAKGNFTFIGNHEIILYATGTPSTFGDHNFILNTSPSSCSFIRTTENVHQTVIGKAGRIWMAYNLGATAPASSITDSKQYGDFYQWGRRADGHEKLNSTTTSVKSAIDTPIHSNFITTSSDWLSTANANLWQGLNGINNPCPLGFRIPTIKEWDDEFTASGIVDNTTAFNSRLKLTLPGYRNINSTADHNAAGTAGYYWSSDVSGTLSSFKHFYSGNSTTNNHRGYGFSVRCIKD